MKTHFLFIFNEAPCDTAAAASLICPCRRPLSFLSFLEREVDASSTLLVSAINHDSQSKYLPTQTHQTTRHRVAQWIL